MCRKMGAFSPSATERGRCDKNGTFFNDVKVEILAVRCNGVAECANGTDENGCELSFYVLMVAVLGGGILAIIVSSVSSKLSNLVILDTPSSTEIEVSESREEEAQNVILTQQADVEIRKSHSQQFYNLTLEQTNENVPETVNTIKLRSTSTSCEF